MMYHTISGDSAEIIPIKSIEVLGYWKSQIVLPCFFFLKIFIVIPMEITLPAAEQLVGLLLNFGFMKFSKKSFMKDPKIILYIRISFFVSVVIQLLICFYIKRKISRINCQKKLKYRPSSSLLNASDSETNEIEISYAEYDNNEATSMLRSVALQSLIYMGVSWKFGAVQSLLIIAFGLFKNLIFSPLYRAYIFGLEIERPYEKNLLFHKKSVSSITPIVSAEKKKKKEE